MISSHSIVNAQILGLRFFYCQRNCDFWRFCERRRKRFLRLSTDILVDEERIERFFPAITLPRHVMIARFCSPVEH